MEYASEIISLILGGGGVTLATIIIKGIKDHAAHETAREDTVINRWRDLASEYQRESEHKSLVIAAYRRTYPRLWTAYYALPCEPKENFPVDPTHGVWSDVDRKDVER